jgi:3-oxoacyl-[acyl-carrier protein] reductase
VAAATAAEGQRALVKSAARQWGAAGITSNVVAFAATAAAPNLFETDTDRTTPALPPVDDPLSDVADAVVVLAGPHAARLTGVTLVANRGGLMVP